MGISTSSLGPMSMMMQAGGTLTKTAGAYASARMRKAQYGYDAFEAGLNSKMATMNAGLAMKQGETQVQQIGLREQNEEGQARTAYAAGGVDLAGGGSPARVIGSNKLIGQVDAQIAAANAIKQAWGYKMEATNFDSAARMDNMMHDNINPTLEGFNSLMGSSSDVAGSWYQMSKSGVFSNGGGSSPMMATTYNDGWQA